MFGNWYLIFYYHHTIKKNQLLLYVQSLICRYLYLWLWWWWSQHLQWYQSWWWLQDRKWKVVLYLSWCNYRMWIGFLFHKLTKSTWQHDNQTVNMQCEDNEAKKTGCDLSWCIDCQLSPCLTVMLCPYVHYFICQDRCIQMKREDTDHDQQWHIYMVENYCHAFQIFIKI